MKTGIICSCCLNEFIAEKYEDGSCPKCKERYTFELYPEKGLEDQFLVLFDRFQQESPSYYR